MKITEIGILFLCIIASLCYAEDTFKVEFSIEKDSYLRGEPIIVDATLINISDTDQNIIFDKSNYWRSVRLIVKDAERC